MTDVSTFGAIAQLVEHLHGMQGGQVRVRLAPSGFSVVISIMGSVATGGFLKLILMLKKFRYFLCFKKRRMYLFLHLMEIQ